MIEHAWVQYGLKSVLTGGGSALEREIGDQIEALCQPGSVINAIGGTSLKGVLALIDQAQAVIAPDTGPIHMANAMGTPALGLYASTNPSAPRPICGVSLRSTPIPRRYAPICINRSMR